MHLGEDRKALLIYDVFQGQTTNLVAKALETNHCYQKKVPNNHTDLCQPLDLRVNRPEKANLSNKYQDWYADWGISSIAAQYRRAWCKSGREAFHAQTSSC